MDMFVLFSQLGEMFEYFMVKYPVYMVLIGIGFFILLMLAFVPRTERVHYYEGQDIPRQVVIHHAPTTRQPRVVHVYDEEPVEYDEPIVTSRKYRRFPDLTNLDPVDNWGFLD